MENQNNNTEKEQVAVVICKEDTVTIPRSEYDMLRKKETLLDLVASTAPKYSWETDDLVKIIRNALSSGKADAPENEEETDA